MGCPKCGSNKIRQEKRPNGKTDCTDCGFVINRGDPLGIFPDKPHALIAVNQMCIESLSPEIMKKWDEVILSLIEAQSDLKGVSYNVENGDMDYT